MKNRYEEPPVIADDKINTGMELAGASSRSTGHALARSLAAKYWWTCYAGAQNDGKGCGFWQVMDVKAEGRGPFVGDISASAESK